MAKAENFSVVGQRVQRVEGYDKVTGESKYIADIALPGMLIGKILRSPYPHARILRIDTSRAERLRGLRAVVTAEDSLKRPWGAFFADQYILSVGKARYVGEEVAAVAAVDSDTADEAVDLIDVEWEQLPPVSASPRHSACAKAIFASFKAPSAAVSAENPAMTTTLWLPRSSRAKPKSPSRSSIPARKSFWPEVARVCS